MPGANDDTAKFRRGAAPSQRMFVLSAVGVGVLIGGGLLALISIRSRAPTTLARDPEVAAVEGGAPAAPPQRADLAPASPAQPRSRAAQLPPSGASMEDQLKAFLAIADSSSREITYAHLKKNAERYRGRAWTFSGKIVEISEVTDAGKELTVARVALDEYQQRVMWIVAPFATDFVEGARVDVTGVLTGSYSYTSQAGWNITIPSLEAAAILKRGSFDKLRGKRERPRVVEEDGTVRYLDGR